jgi:hypothetical protein
MHTRPFAIAQSSSSPAGSDERRGAFAATFGCRLIGAILAGALSCAPRAKADDDSSGAQAPPSIHASHSGSVAFSAPGPAPKHAIVAARPPAATSNGNLQPETRTMTSPVPLPNQPPANEPMLRLPPGWTKHIDPQQRATFLLPPGINNPQEIALIAFPAVNSSANPEVFHAQTLHNALNNSRQSELIGPTRQISPDGFLVSKVHYLTPQGQAAWLALYTVRWAGRAKAYALVTSREDYFQQYDPALEQMISQIPIPAAGGAATSLVDNLSPPAAPGSAAPVGSQGGPEAGGENMVPVLRYNEPQNFYRGASKYPVDYSSREVNCSVQVYGFQPYPGDAAADFQRTLLRDKIAIMHKEEPLAGAPVFGENHMPGADRVIDARFHEAKFQTPTERLRILIIAGGRVALVDVTANNPFTWNKAWPNVQPMLASLHIERQAGPPSVTAGPGPGGAALAGLFLGSKMKYQVNLNRPVGYGDTVAARHYYLFSADGRVFRRYDLIPGDGDWQHFNFEASEQEDPVNTGRFTVRDNVLYIQMAGQPNEPITANIVNADELQIESVTYERAR